MYRSSTRILAAALLFLSAGVLHAKEIKSMQAILSYINQETLVVFDIDNTLAEARQMLGTDQSFEWMKSKYLKAGFDEKTSTTKALAYWAEVQNYSEMKPVESSTPQLLRYLQNRKTPVLALTARGFGLAKRTAKQLENIGMSFSGQAQNVVEPSLGYYRGMILATGRNKGLLLKAYLRRFQPHVRRVIFVDDKEHNVSDVQHAFENSSWQLYAFRYSRADQTVKSFDPRVAEAQSHYLKRILSDEHAQAILTLPRR